MDRDTTNLLEKMLNENMHKVQTVSFSKGMYSALHLVKSIIDENGVSAKTCQMVKEKVAYWIDAEDRAKLKREEEGLEY